MIVFWMDALSWGWGSEGERLSHLKANREVWASYRQNRLMPCGWDYIESQTPALKPFLIGCRSGDYNGCGAVAAYNACLCLFGGRPPLELPEIIYEIEREGLVIGGRLGTSIVRLKELFEEMGVGAALIKNPLGGRGAMLSGLDPCGPAYIILIVNDKSKLFSGLHFIAVTRSDSGELKPHNCSHLRREAAFAEIGDVLDALRREGAHAVALLCLSRR